MSKPKFSRSFVAAMLCYLASYFFFALIFLLGEWKHPDQSLFYIDVFATYFFFRMGWLTLTKWKKESKENNVSSK